VSEFPKDYDLIKDIIGSFLCCLVGHVWSC